ncbi:MAG: electron transport complex subunit RsxC [Spirochaetia bacterium]|jgi:electron transport complex protein RnfC
MRYQTKLPRGGVDPPSEMLVPLGSGIANAAVPSRAVIPLLQHAGKPAVCMVKPGDQVREGMLIGEADGSRSARVHASIPGIVVEVRDHLLPTGQACAAVIIELGGEFETSGRPPARREWESLSRLDLLDRVRTAGVVGLGGESMPTHLKLAVPPGSSSSILVANGVESEPSLCADEALLHAKPFDIMEGLRVCQALLKPARTVVAIGEHAEDLVPEIERVVRQKGMETDVAVLPSRYPQGHEQLVLAALGGQPPGGERVQTVLNVATLNAIFEAVVLNKPLIERVMTVTGSSLSHPQNLKVRFGTGIRELIEECGGLASGAGKIVMGGPMRGVAVDSLDLPVTKGTSGIIAFGGPDSRQHQELPCIRCGNCIEACPWDLVPTRLFKLIRIGDAAAAAREGLSGCTECGCCAYSCPSRIPLVAVLREGKRRLRALNG